MPRLSIILLTVTVAATALLIGEGNAGRPAGATPSATETCATESTTVTSVGQITDTACVRSAPPSVKFVFPQGSTTWDGAVALAANEVNAIPLNLLTEAVFEYSADGGATFIPIDSVRADQRYFETVWQTAGLAAGDYLVRVALSDILGNLSSDTITLHVNGQPVAKAVFSCPSTTTVDFEATSSFDPDPGGSIVSYNWDFGDGSLPATGAIVPHSYPAPGTYFAELTVVDNLGAIGVSHFGVDTLLCEEVPKGCDPEGMTIEHATPPGASWKMYWIKKAADKQKLGLYHTIENWATAPDDASFQIVANFEVVVELKPNSDPSKCDEGQSVQRTATFGPKTYKLKEAKAGAQPHDPPPGGEVECEYNDPQGDWCHDNYRKDRAHTISKIGDAKEGWTKVHVDQSHIRWLDGPGDDDVLKKTIKAAGGFTYKAKFQASVKGDTKTAKCSWEVDITATGDGGTFTVNGQGVHNINCQVTIP
ncbi:MAG: PKD domain-containing protein [Chloroflexota bacterium]|nr:PKD domain-containing protein [Chloroflexota bacterium]